MGIVRTWTTNHGGDCEIGNESGGRGGKTAVAKENGINGLIASFDEDVREEDRTNERNGRIKTKTRARTRRGGVTSGTSTWAWDVYFCFVLVGWLGGARAGHVKRRLFITYCR